MERSVCAIRNDSIFRLDMSDARISLAYRKPERKPCYRINLSYLFSNVKRFEKNNIILLIYFQIHGFMFNKSQFLYGFCMSTLNIISFSQPGSPSNNSNKANALLPLNSQRRTTEYNYFATAPYHI